MLGAPGAHLAMNSLAALAACDALGVDLNPCLASLEHWKIPAGRGAREVILLPKGGKITLIDESYNANPTSMAAALAVLAESNSGGRKIAVLGDMLELGKTEAGLHQGLATLQAMKSLDQVHLVGPMMRQVYRALPADKRGQWAPDVGTLAAQIKALLQSGDTVMVKGSLGTGLSKIVDEIRKMGA
jgi:UDP-N-acetylmuramoyl-tripeptide--D-alanyl-D-alanine ligase